MGNPSHVNDTEGSEDDAVQAGPVLHPATPAADEPEIAFAAPDMTPVYRRKHPVLRRILLLAVLAILVGNGALLWMQRDVIMDWVHTRGYVAPQNIVQLADDDTMTPYARRIFYVNYPAIEDKDAFNRDCPDASHEVAVLGCYRGNRNGIYLYKVNDVRLDGITQVTAAHEMLHQAFDRLQPAERKHIGELLNDYYKNHLTDKNVIDKMASYKKLEPDDMTNEMHSVFGTEITNLPPELETYYKRYFTDRRKVLDYRNKYVSAFSARQDQIDAYDKQRDILKQQIDDAQSALDSWEKALKAQRDQMSADMAAGEIARYNAAVPGFNAQVQQYKAKVTETNDLINKYNDITDKRNALTAQEQELIKAQDSHASSANAE